MIQLEPLHSAARQGPQPGLFLANLERHAPLSGEERSVAEGLMGPWRLIQPGADLVADGEPAVECLVLLEGQAYRHKTLPDGRRQILSFHAPGDLLDLQRVFLGIDYTVTALTSCKVAAISRERLVGLMAEEPRIAMALWRLTLIEAATFREWMVGIGRRTAYARMAHLLCEVFLRLDWAGLARRNRCYFPVTQAHLADSLGLSTVHTNRVLQELRRASLIALRGRELIVLDWPGLRSAGEFDEGYLHAGGGGSMM